MEDNDKESLGKRTSHFDINHFYVTDLVSQNKVNIKYCPTDEIIEEYMTKLLVGENFELLQYLIMNISSNRHRIGQQEYVGQNIKGLKGVE